MALDTCNLCGKSLSEKGSGGTTIGVSLATNQLTVSHTKCRDMYREPAKPIHIFPHLHIPQT